MLKMEYNSIYQQIAKLGSHYLSDQKPVGTRKAKNVISIFKPGNAQS